MTEKKRGGFGRPFRCLLTPYERDGLVSSLRESGVLRRRMFPAGVEAVQKKLFYCPRKTAFILDLARFALQKHLKSNIARLEDFDVTGDDDDTVVIPSPPRVYVVQGLASDGHRYVIEVEIKSQPREGGLWTAERVSIVTSDKLMFRAEFETVYYFSEKLFAEYTEQGGSKFTLWKLPSVLWDGEFRERRR